MKKVVTHKQSHQLNIYSGYTYIQGLHREILCMKLLYNTFLTHGCTCGRNKPHFPIMLNNKIGSNSGYITMTHQGMDIQKMRQKQQKVIIDNESIHNQIDCIMNILNKAQIVHLDLNDNGKNICINDDGHISIIDFDIMYLKYFDNMTTLTPLMLKRINRFKNTDFKKKIYNIIQKVTFNNMHMADTEEWLM